MAESAPNGFGADPLNLMRVMPPKGARVDAGLAFQPCVQPRMAFCLTANRHEWTQTRMAMAPL